MVVWLGDTEGAVQAREGDKETAWAFSRDPGGATL